MTKKTDSPVGAKWVVWSVWAALTVTAAGYVIHFGSNVPYWDEWSMVDVVSGAQPLTLEWLWSPHNGHRVLLPRLVLLGLYKVSGVDFRVGMYFNVAVLAAASAALVWASSRMRGGQISVANTVFPWQRASLLSSPPPFELARRLPRFIPHSVVFLVATITVAALSWHLFERPINQLKRRFPYGEAGTESSMDPQVAGAARQHC